MPISIEPTWSSRQMNGAVTNQDKEIRVHQNWPPPIGFGSNVPSRERLAPGIGSIPSTPQTPLTLGVVGGRVSPHARVRQHQTEEAQRAKGARATEATAERTGIAHAEEERSVMSFLSKHNSVKHTYVLDPAYKKKENVHDGVRRMSGKEKSRWYGEEGKKASVIQPPPKMKPTIGQQRRAKADGPPGYKKPLMAHPGQPRPRSRGEEMATADMEDNGVVPRPPFEVAAETPPVVLDGFLLLNAASADLPEEVEVANISGMNIFEVVDADIAHFSSLRDLNASDNKLQGLLPLCLLPSLQFLNVAANGLSTLTILPDSMTNLLEIDLSFNCLTADAAFQHLNVLPSLRKLDLSGNSIPRLPDKITGFAALQELTLACNGLKGESLLSLQALPSLERLFMQDNVVSKIPDWTATEPFPSLLELDLTNNQVRSAAALLPLEELPRLQRVVLAGNPLSDKAHLAAKRAAQAKEAEYKAAGLAHLTADVEQVLQAAVAPDPLPLALPAPPGGGSREAPQAAAATPPLSRIRVELKAPELKRPSIGKVYAHGQLPVVVDDLAKQLPVPGNPLAGLSGMLREEDINHNAVMEAFSRLDSEIQGWGEHAEATGYGLLPVEEGAEEAEDYTDNTFLTGVAMEGNRGEAQEDAEPRQEDSAEGTARGGEDLPEEMKDPTVQLAVELGMDPMHLAIFSGHLGGDCTSAIKALRFALSHPLVNENEGLRPKPNHFKTTSSTRAKQRKPFLKPIDSLAPQLPRVEDVKMQRIQSIEEILAGMKSRLNQVESNLVAEIGPESAEAALALVDMRGSSAATTVRVGTAASAANDSHAGQKSAASTPKQQPGGGPGATAPPGRPAVPPINAAATKEAASSALGYS